MAVKSWFQKYGLELSIVAISLCLVTLAVWYKVGVHQHVPLYEEWGTIDLLENDADIVPTPGYPGRPLRSIPFWVLYQMGSDFVLNLNLALVVLFLMRGALTYLIIRQLFPANKFIALFTSLLFLLYPAGNGFFSARAFVGNTTLAIGLLAIALVLYYWRNPRGWLWIFIWSAQCLSLLMYELNYVIFALVPLGFWWIDQRIHFSQRFWKVSVLWYSGEAILAIRYIVLLLNKEGTYLNSRISKSQNADSIETLAFNNIKDMYTDHINGWFEAIQNYHFNGFYLIVALVIGLLSHLLLRQDSRPQKSTPTTYKFKHYSILLGFSLIWMVAGFIMYASISHVEEDFRVYFLSGLGASTALVMLIYLITWQVKSNLKILMLNIILIFLVMLGIEQTAIVNEADTEKSFAIQRLFAEIVTTVPNPTDDTIILVVDEGLIYQDEKIAGISSPLWMALDYIYGRDIEAYICRLDKKGVRDQCIFHDTHIQHVSGTIWGEHEFPYEKLIVFKTTSDGHIFLLNTLPYSDTPYDQYQPHNLIAANQPLPDRANEFFTCLPLSECDPYTPELELATNIRLDFDKEFEGTGWEIYQANRATRWMIGHHATLTFYLMPNQPYQLRFQGNVLDAIVWDDLEVWVNGKPIDLIRHGTAHQAWFEGTIPSQVVGEYTLVEFRVTQTTIPSELEINADERELAINFEWLEIEAISDETINSAILLNE